MSDVPLSHDHVAFLCRYAHNETRLNRQAMLSLHLNPERMEPLVESGLVDHRPARDGKGATYAMTDKGNHVADLLLSEFHRLMKGY